MKTIICIHNSNIQILRIKLIAFEQFKNEAELYFTNIPQLMESLRYFLIICKKNPKSKIYTEKEKHQQERKEERKQKVINVDLNYFSLSITLSTRYIFTKLLKTLIQKIAQSIDQKFLFRKVTCVSIQRGRCQNVLQNFNYSQNQIIHLDLRY
ncbi:unnamed protein product [Paramecium pentaurelia]|uniref:Uncharacterized protein n=1 Tax=Paramecium pentaurelia TaxID=43138 RepID=A0A8S1TH62_9CILI|nr:unnamed protein product [Paramecium pentaurelia]